MKIVVLDGYTENPGDLSWGPLEALGELTVYDRTSYEESPLIAERIGVQPTIINPYYITGLDEALLEELKHEHEVVITLEDGILDGGFGEKIARFYGASAVKTLNYGLKKEFLDRCDVDEVLRGNHLTAEQIAADVMALL